MAHDTLYAIGEALIDMIPSKTGCSFAEVPSFSPRVGGAPRQRVRCLCPPGWRFCPADPAGR